MIKKQFLILISFVFISGGLVTAQGVSMGTDTTKADDNEKMAKKERYMFGMGNDFWLDAPGNADIRNYNPSFVVSFMFDHPFGTSPLSFAAGLGLQSNNLYSDAFIQENDINQKSKFKAIPDSLDYSKNKISTTYLELPVELRLRMLEDNDLTIAAGFKVGYLINSHTKYKGDNYLNTGTSNSELKIKEHNIPNLVDLRYTATARIAYKNFSLFAHYNLTPLFEEDKLVDNSGDPNNMYLITTGLLFSPF
ncbi:MAG: PorT family protein [Bacteroidales bacterium]|nr:PorT family protein [Bacteroidales bacterium]MCF8326918.1 PorT family protein [Bacteroidales bacterium]